MNEVKQVSQSYKIKVSNEAESREAQELFFELGYSWNSGRTTTDNEKSPYLYTSEDFGLWCGDLHATFNESGKKEITLPQLRDLVSQKQPDQDLISGADALRALADGKCVQWMTGDEFNDVTDEWQIREFNHPSFKFRLKPTTIAITMTIPVPFEPKIGEKYWFLSGVRDVGYSSATFENDDEDKRLMLFGAWRTEEEVAQVYEEFSKIKGASV